MNYKSWFSKSILLLFAGVLGAVIMLGCSRKPATTAENTAGEKRDYRQMIERVRNRTAYNASLEEVKNAVEKFQVDLGRLPTNLLELVRFNYLPKVPEKVPEGYTFGYDYVRGRVSFVKMPENQ